MPILMLVGPELLRWTMLLILNIYFKILHGAQVTHFSNVKKLCYSNLSRYYCTRKIGAAYILHVMQTGMVSRLLEIIRF